MTDPQSATGLRLHVHYTRDTPVVTAIGEVDEETAPALHERIAACVAERPRRLIIDLTGVTFLSSAGLHVLVQANVQTPRLGVVAADRATLRPLQLTGLDRILALYPSLEQAMIDTVAS